MRLGVDICGLSEVIWDGQGHFITLVWAKRLREPQNIPFGGNVSCMEKVRPWCGQPSDRGRLKNKNRTGLYLTYYSRTCCRTITSHNHRCANTSLRATAAARQRPIPIGGSFIDPRVGPSGRYRGPCCQNATLRYIIRLSISTEPAGRWRLQWIHGRLVRLSIIKAPAAFNRYCAVSIMFFLTP